MNKILDLKTNQFYSFYLGACEFSLKNWILRVQEAFFFFLVSRLHDRKVVDFINEVIKTLLLSVNVFFDHLFHFKFLENR
jgi:hypothetical protein